MGLENPLHIALILVVVLLVFGAKRVPEIGRSLGKGLREFKDSITGESEPHALPPAPAEPAAPPPAPDNAEDNRPAAPVGGPPESSS